MQISLLIWKKGNKMTDYTELTQNELQAKRDEFEKAMLEAKMDILKLTTNEAKTEAQEIINGYKNDLQEIDELLEQYDDLDGDLVDGVDYAYNMEFDRAIYS